jgi:hypothetical protein
VRRIGCAQPPRVLICRAWGASWPVAASFASLPVNLARRSSAECRPADASVMPCVEVGGSWSCAGMGGWPFRRKAEGERGGAGCVGRPKRSAHRGMGASWVGADAGTGGVWAAWVRW